MDEKQTKPWEQDYYQTGSTQPPKSRSGIIAFLLILVILLTGLVGILGMQNIRLFQALSNSDLSSLSDPPDTSASTATTGHAGGQPSLGISGEEVSSVSQHYYNIPAGLYITQVSDQAHTQGLRTGDILLDVNGSRITTAQELAQAVSACQVGDTASVTVYRDHKQLNLSLKVEAKGP